MQEQKEQWFYHSDEKDPVFEGMVKEFVDFHTSLEDILAKLDVLLASFDQFSQGIRNLSDGLFNDLSRLGSRHFASESCRLKEMTNQIVHLGGPRSARAKLHKNFEYNIKEPVQSHLDNCLKVRQNIEKRQRRLDELRSAKQQVDQCKELGLDDSDHRLALAQSEFQTCWKAFQEIDRRIFEWLYVIEEHKGDILDSLLQTLKYLQYEFFARSAHALSGALPDRIEFRPMVDMTPECLRSLVEMELSQEEDQESLSSANKSVSMTVDATGCFTTRMIERLAKDADAASTAAVSVDVMSLSILLSQGFDDALARRALRLHGNDTQAALDWLLSGGAEDCALPATALCAPDPDVPMQMPARVPTGGARRMQRLRELKERREARNGAHVDSPSPPARQPGASGAGSSAAVPFALGESLL